MVLGETKRSRHRNAPMKTRHLPISRRFIIANALLAALSLASGADAEKLETGVWLVPRGFIDWSNSTSSQNTPIAPLSGFRSNQPAELSQYDASEFLKASGVEFPSGSEAIVDAGTGTLVVRNTSNSSTH